VCQKISKKLQHREKAGGSGEGKRRIAEEITKFRGSYLEANRTNKGLVAG